MPKITSHPNKKNTKESMVIVEVRLMMMVVGGIDGRKMGLIKITMTNTIILRILF